jgi:hypothetical protein
MRIMLMIAISALFWPFSTFAQSADSPVDIAIEAATIAPAFYAGRHEPAAGSRVRAVAIVEGHLSSALTFRWEVNGNVVSSEHGNTLSFAAPLGTSFRIRVDAFDAHGTRLGSDEEIVPLREPIIAFYPLNLLRGTSHTAITDTYILTDDEVSVRAEPYFMDRDVFDVSHKVTWKVDGRPVTDLLTDPQVITLRRTEGTGSADVSFTLQNGVAFGQRAEGTFTLTF